MFIRQNPINPKLKWRFDSYIGYNRSWWSYYTQYKNVIDELVNKIEQDTPIDTVALPLLFLIRHSLEIALKANILKFEKVNHDVEKIKLKGTKYHSIENLFNKFKEHLNKIKKGFNIERNIVVQIDDYLEKCTPMVTKFQKLDKGSFNFRYPVDTNGNYNFAWDTRINISDIIDLYYSIHPFLIFTERGVVI
jgi:hypothetical protein